MSQDFNETFGEIVFQKSTDLERGDRVPSAICEGEVYDVLSSNEIKAKLYPDQLMCRDCPLQCSARASTERG